MNNSTSAQYTVDEAIEKYLHFHPGGDKWWLQPSVKNYLEHGKVSGSFRKAIYKILASASPSQVSAEVKEEELKYCGKHDSYGYDKCTEQCNWCQFEQSDGVSTPKEEKQEWISEQDLEIEANKYAEYHYSEPQLKHFHAIAFAAYMACGRKRRREAQKAKQAEQNDKM